MICNFPPSTAEIPSTISHDDVNTLFHEFGHLIHVMCNDQRICSFGSFCEETDFVETPSQVVLWTVDHSIVDGTVDLAETCVTTSFTPLQDGRTIT